MNSLPSETIAHILSFLSPTDLTRFSLCSFQIYEENRLLLESYRALYHTRPAYLDCIKSMVIREHWGNGIRLTERPGGLLTIYSLEIRQTIFTSMNLKLSGLAGRTCVLRKGQVRIVYLDSDCLTKNSPTGELCNYGSLYITEKTPKETYIEERERKLTKTALTIGFVMICTFCLFLLA